MRIVISSNFGMTNQIMDDSEVQFEIRAGRVDPNALWVESTGQTQGQLRQIPHSDWKPVRDLLAARHEAVVAATTAHTPMPESGPSLLRFLGVVWLVCGIVGCILVWSEFGSIESRFGGYSELSPVGVAMAIGIFLQGLLVFALCFELAKISDRVYALFIIRNR